MRKPVIAIMMVTLLLVAGAFAVRGSSRDMTDGRQIPTFVERSLEARPPDTTQVTQMMTTDELLDIGFEKVADNGRLALYLDRASLNIAVDDLDAGYLWTGFHPDILDGGFTDSVRQTIESGVTVSVYDATTLNELTRSLTDPDAGTQITYTMTGSGFDATVNMEKLGLTFDVQVSLDGASLKTVVPHESIIEVPYKTVAMKVAKEYKTRSIVLFPYFGSGNHEINGYAMVPDGTGALIRYEDIPYGTAYVKRLYGEDIGIRQTDGLAGHLKRESGLSVPVYGINHGYRQAAFLTVLESGFGAAELHSLPYMYNNIPINTTHFVYRTRDRALITLSGGEISTIPIINANPYPADFRLSYTFLSNEDAGYSGMARTYRNMLFGEDGGFVPKALDLSMIGIDFKHGLLGKQDVVLTTYDQAEAILSDLLESGVGGIMAGYESWNTGGAFGRRPTRFSPASKLGGRRGLEDLSAYVESQDTLDFYLMTDPLVLTRQSWFDRVLRKTTLNLLEMPLENLEHDLGAVRPVTEVSDTILDQKDAYAEYGITSVALSTVGGTAFSYQLGGETVYREDMIAQMTDEIVALDRFGLVLDRPNAYLYHLVDAYRNMPLGHNGYAFMTDAVPFLPMVLLGNMGLYSEPLNTASDPSTSVLSMIGYGIRPSFNVIFTEGYMLRHTNYESLQSGTYDIWKDTIIDVTTDIDSVLSTVAGSSMDDHIVMGEGCVRTTWSNGVVIYVNNQLTDIMCDGLTIPARSAKVVGP